ncbi:MAG: DUF4332 domain-containing protein [Cocleimonas sp.]|nr:DUF4332 domain-containing protein [Cocleimonas sp.]
MAYLLSQIWLCLLITALVAGLLGWLLRGGGKKKLNTLNEKWQDKYDALSQERNSYASKINKLSGVTHEKERLESKIETQKHTYNQKLERLTIKLATADEETHKQQSLLAQKDEELAMSMAQFDSKISEYEDDQQSSSIDLEKKLEHSSSQLSLLEKDTQNRLKEYQQKNTTLETKLKSTKTDLDHATNKLVDIEKDLGKGELQVDNLTKGFAIKEKKLTEQLEEKEEQISNALVEKEKAETRLQQANTLQKTLKKDLATKEDKLKKQLAKDSDLLSHAETENKAEPDLNQAKPVNSDNITAPSEESSKKSLLDKVSTVKDSALETIKAPLDYAKNISKKEEIKPTPAKQNKVKQKITPDELSQKTSDTKDAVTTAIDQKNAKPEEKSILSDKSISGFDKEKASKEDLLDNASTVKDSAVESIKAPLDYAPNTPKKEKTQPTPATTEQNKVKKKITPNELSQKISDTKDAITTAPIDQKNTNPEEKFESSAVSDKLTSAFDKAKAGKKDLLDKVSTVKDSAVESIKAPLDYAPNTPKKEKIRSTPVTAEQNKVKKKITPNELSQKISDTKDAITTAPVDHVVQKNAIPEEKNVFSDIKEKFESSGVSDKLKSSFDKAKEGIHSAKEEIVHKASDAKDSIKSYNHNQDSNENSSNGIKGMFASAGIAELAMSGIEKAKDGLSQAKESLTHYPDAEESNFPIDAIQSISNEDDRRLYIMGIKTTQDLLTKTSTDTGINLLSKSLGKEKWVVHGWVNNADLIRIKGVDGILAELLELAGFNTTTKLAASNADNVLQEISTVHEYITKRSTLPSIDEIQGFIDGAKALT